MPRAKTIALSLLLLAIQGCGCGEERKERELEPMDGLSVLDVELYAKNE
jgi:hypothetical protein